MLREDPLKQTTSMLLWDAALKGDFEDVKELLTRPDININYKSHDVTPLYLAIARKDASIVETLLKNGADPNIPCDDGLTPLVMAILEKNESLVSLLLQYGASIDTLCNGLVTALSAAVENDQLSTVKLLIAAGSDVNRCSHDGTSPLFIAASQGHCDIVQALLAAGAKVDVPSPANFRGENDDILFTDTVTPLCIAALNDHIAIIDILNKHGANPNYVSPLGITPLQCAHMINHHDAAKKLIQQGAAVDVSQGWLYKQFAKFKSYLDKKKYDWVLTQEIFAEEAMCNGFALWWLVNRNHPFIKTFAGWDGCKESLTNTLFDHFEEFAHIYWLQSPQYSLTPGIRQNMSDKLLNFIAEKNHHYHIPFQFGFVMDHEELVTVLRELMHDQQKIWISNLGHTNGHALSLTQIGSDYYLYDSNAGAGEIMCHSLDELALKIELICHRGKILPFTGVSLQVIADQSCHRDYQPIKDRLVSYFMNRLQKGDAAKRTDFGYNPIAYAICVNDLQIVNILIESGISIHQNPSCKTSLLLATTHADTAMTERLIQAGADVNEISNNSTPLFAACHLGDYEKGALLLKHGVNPRLECNNATALRKAAYNGHIEIMKLLIEKANPPHDACMLANALLSAIIGQQLAAVKYLISVGTLPSASNINLLHQAIYTGNLPMVRFLIEEGHYSVLTPDDRGVYPINFALLAKDNNVHGDAVYRFLIQHAIGEKDKNSSTLNTHSIFKRNDLAHESLNAYPGNVSTLSVVPKFE